MARVLIWQKTEFDKGCCFAAVQWWKIWFEWGCLLGTMIALAAGKTRCVYVLC